MHILEKIKLKFKRKKKPAKVNMFEQDCLVGIVKNEQQLTVNLACRFYHIPAKFVYELDMPVKYVALYMSAKTFGREKSGIIYYGKVKDYRVVQRRTITELPKDSDEQYFVFNIEKWEKLTRRIKPLEIISISTATSLELLKNIEYAAEMYLRNEEEYRLFQYLKAICIKGERNKSYNYFGTKIKATASNIEVIYSNGERRKYDYLVYKNKPYELFRSIIIRHRF